MNLEEAVNPSKPIYREWLVPSFMSFFVTLIILPSCVLVFLPINPLLGFVIGTLMTVAIWVGMLAASSTITVIDKELRVSKAHIPVHFLSGGRVIEKEFRFAERGPSLDNAAFVRFQVGVKPLIRLENTDPQDPTPYWLLATRRPNQLLEAIEKAQD